VGGLQRTNISQFPENGHSLKANTQKQDREIL
jgi:hypothetical protein